MKKLSSGFTDGWPRSDATSALIRLSSSDPPFNSGVEGVAAAFAGSGEGVGAPSGSRLFPLGRGRAALSSLPLAVSGSLSRATNESGIM